MTAQQPVAKKYVVDHLRNDPGLKLVCGHLPDSRHDLCSQPTVSRLENIPALREVVRMTDAMVDLYCANYARPQWGSTALCGTGLYLAGSVT